MEHRPLEYRKREIRGAAAVGVQLDGKGVDWMEKVSGEQYQAESSAD
jgi:hypothetical protein